MKNAFVMFTFLFLTKSVTLFSQNIEALTINGKVHYGTKEIPNEMLGIYYYEKDKEPIVDIRKGGTGLFQMHQVKAEEVQFFIETDAKGEIFKIKGKTTDNFESVLIVKFGNSNESKIERYDIRIMYTTGYAVILRERFKKL